ncbi:unnamed protein product, partial [Ectocarpus fasciculatus]
MHRRRHRRLYQTLLRLRRRRRRRRRPPVAAAVACGFPWGGLLLVGAASTRRTCRWQGRCRRCRWGTTTWLGPTRLQHRRRRRRRPRRTLTPPPPSCAVCCRRSISFAGCPKRRPAVASASPL